MNMIEQAKSYAKQFIQRIEPLMSEPTPFETTQRVCFSINSHTISLLHLDITDGSVDILLNETIEFDALENLTIILADFTKRYQLQHIPCCWLLSIEDYQLFFIDALPVKNDEFKDALNWRVRGLLNYPLQEAAIDYFLLPAKKGSANQPMVVAAAARKQQLTRVIDIISKVGMQFATIDIPELALHNLSAACENDEKTTAFLYFFENSAILNLTREKVLYFTRRIALTKNYSDDPHFYESISLELLRYFDYFQSQWRYPSPTRFYIASSDDKTSTIISGLAKHLMIQLEPFPLARVILKKGKIAKLDDRALLCLGVALQQEGAHATTEY